MKIILTLLAILTLSTLTYSQTIVEWKEDELITLQSFEGELPDLAEDQIQQYTFAATFDFNFQMLNMQFAFTKNFNQYVKAYYVPSLSWIEKGELNDQLLLMANLDYDLVELYARKFRKRLYESKNVASNVDFYNSIFLKINQEYSNRQTVIQSELRGQEDYEAYLKDTILKVNQEIKEMAEFCKTCKPKKKKK